MPLFQVLGDDGKWAYVEAEKASVACVLFEEACGTVTKLEQIADAVMRLKDRPEPAEGSAVQ